MEYKFEIDQLTNEHVSIKKTEVITQNGVEFFGNVHRKVYLKTEGWKVSLQQEIPEPYLSTILISWESQERIAINTDEIIADDDLLLALPAKYFKEFDESAEYVVGDIFVWYAIKYKVIQNRETWVGFEPETVSARTYVIPYQGNNRVRWAYKEPIRQGYIREYDGVYYRALNNLESESNATTPFLGENWGRE